MPQPPEDLAARYAALAETDLMDLARAYDTLTEPAQSALRAEFAHRHLEPPTIDDSELPAKLVTVRRFRDLSEAIVARSLLESAGLVVYLFDENLVRLDWQLSNFIGGIRLQVEAADEATALEILAQPVPEDIPFAGPGTPSEDFHQPHCPRCDSLDITFEGASRAATITALYVLSVPLPSGRKSWLCNNCGARWEEIEDETNTDWHGSNS